MGMAASQARLLSITARIHDVEYQAQSIQNAKVQLATQSDQVYNDYMEALDAQSLTFSTLGADGEKTTLIANFNNLFSINAATLATGGSAGLRNERGFLVVDDDIYQAYQKFAKANDPYAFAIYLLGGDNTTEAILGTYEDGCYQNTIRSVEEDTYNKKKEEAGSDSEIVNLHKALEEYVGEGKNIYDGSEVSDKDKDKYESTLKQYRALLYSKYAEDICTANHENFLTVSTTIMSEQQFDYEKLHQYIDKYNQIKMCGGCVPISDYNGSYGNASNNGEWLTSMIECGKFTIDIFKKDSKGEYTRTTTSPGSDSCISYTATSSVDNTVAKKAEAKYEHDLKEIDKKDKKFDLSLSKLETERTALTTEYDSVKKVIEDNIDRTFGIFS